MFSGGFGGSLSGSSSFGGGDFGFAFGCEFSFLLLGELGLGLFGEIVELFYEF